MLTTLVVKDRDAGVERVAQYAMGARKLKTTKSSHSASLYTISAHTRTLPCVLPMSLDAV